MRYGIIGDIHSNLEALRATLEYLRKESVDKYICVGDIVGYGADPRECIRLVRQLDCLFVAGNHDYAATGKLDLDAFNQYARQAAEWTREQLVQEDRDFIEAMPLVLKRDSFTLVHATLEAPQEWRYIYSTYEAVRAFRALETQICFTGHSHLPVTFISNKTCRHTFEERLALADDLRYMVNPGSVGQPRDGNSRASCAIYEPDTGRIETRRIEYNVQEAQRKILAAGLPPVLALRLARGE